jgi:SAM-dependent methyltransferase
MLDTGKLRGFLKRALAEHWTRPAILVSAISRVVAENDHVRAALVRAARISLKSPNAMDILDPASLAALTSDTLFRCLLRSSRVTGMAMERLLTAARSLLLQAAIHDNGLPDPDLLAFYSALAEQCFINGYVFGTTGNELDQVDALRAFLDSGLRTDDPIPPLRLVAVAAYMPLHRIAAAEALLRRSWPKPVALLLDRQILEPIEERRLAATIPAFTAIEDSVSRAVRNQYEENPYPVWVGVPQPQKLSTLEAELVAKFPHAPIRARKDNSHTDILIAGCGTGQQAVEIAEQYAGASVLAVDLSLASLCYAKRQTEALGLRNVEYAQADILQLGALDRSFDLIVSTGVLHHMADPEAGLAVLLSRLRSDGILLLGFYSELARQDVVAAQRYAAERGFTATAYDIRSFRQEIMDLDDGSPLKAIATVPDFYSTSECRDLLFHVREHRMTLPAIKAMLARHDLEFLGFEIDSATRGRYAAAHLADRAMRDLDGWHAFEERHPKTFAGMYQFWAQKRT